MNAGFLGSGWNFPVQIDKHGGICQVSAEEKIKQSILLILSTAKGERVMRPEFGCDIHQFVFAVIDSSTVTMIKSAVKEALILFEPRIEVKAVEVDTRQISTGILEIHLDYLIRTINAEANLVFPFYMNAEGA